MHHGQHHGLCLDAGDLAEQLCARAGLCSGSSPAPARMGSCVGCAAMPELRDSASVGRGMLWEQGELAKEKREGGREGE